MDHCTTPPNGERLRWTTKDEKDLRSYLNDAMTDVAGLRAFSFALHVVGGERDYGPSDLQVSRAFRRRKMDEIREQLLSGPSGDAHWAAIVIHFGEKRRADRRFIDEFRDLAPLARFTASVRARAELLALQHERERIAQRAVASSATERDYARGPEAAPVRTSPMTAAMRACAAMEAVTTPPAWLVLELTDEVILRAMRKTRRDEPFLTDVRREARALRDDAAHAWVTARRALGGLHIEERNEAKATLWRREEEAAQLARLARSCRASGAAAPSSKSEDSLSSAAE